MYSRDHLNNLILLSMIQGEISLWKITLKIVDVVIVVMIGGIIMADNSKVDLLLSQFPVVTLNSGVTICNFSSFHSY